MAKQGSGAGSAALIAFLILCAVGVGLGWFVYHRQQMAAPAIANNEAVQLINSGNYEEALRVLEAAIQKWPTESKFYVNRASALQEMGKYEEAIEEWKKVAEMDSEFVTKARLEIQTCEEFLEGE